MSELKPFSGNVIFFDSEFSTNDPYTSELLSVGLIKLSREELYLELEHTGEISDWVKENILPGLKGDKVKRQDAASLIKEFVGDKNPYVISYVYLFDIIDLHKLFGSKSIRDLPFHWLPIDFASILFGMGQDPYSLKDENFLKKIGVDTEKFKHTHNALDDARLLREVYIKLSNQI